jgi:hypothetical protein
MAAKAAALALDWIAAPGVVGNWPPVEPVNATSPLVATASAVELAPVKLEAAGPPSSAPQISVPEGENLLTIA